MYINKYVLFVIRNEETFDTKKRGPNRNKHYQKTQEHKKRT